MLGGLRRTGFPCGNRSVARQVWSNHVHGSPWRYALFHRLAFQFGLSALRRNESDWTAVYDYPGQKLRLTDQPLSGAKKKRPTVTVAQASSKPKAAPKQPAAKTPRAKAAVTRRPEPARAAAKAPQKTAASGSKTWHRPLPQKPSVVFGKNSKGLDYAISSRARVRNTRSGEVVYAGNGIAGFERLVIVKHSSELLSAYSFNGKMLVAEQQQVGGGEVIADILPRPGVGQTLHFELRRKGLPINPQTLIR